MDVYFQANFLYLFISIYFITIQQKYYTKKRIEGVKSNQVHTLVSPLVTLLSGKPTISLRILNEGSPKPLRQHYRIDGLKGSPNWGSNDWERQKISDAIYPYLILSIDY